MGTANEMLFVDEPSSGLLPLLGEEQGRLYAVLDPAADPRILPLVRASGEPYVSLFQQREGGARALELSPHLVALSGASDLLEELIDEGSGHSWGVYLSSHAGLEEVRGRLRRLLMVDADPADRAAPSVLFRFYDPRVLRVFLPAAGPAHLAAFFGVVTTWIAEGSDAGTVRRFRAEVPTSTPARMLRFEAEQCAALAAGAEAEFQRRAAAFVAARFPSARRATSEERRVRTAAATARAREYGLITESEIMTFVVASWLLGADFDRRSPEVGEQLGSRSRTGGEKMRWLSRWADRQAVGAAEAPDGR